MGNVTKQKQITISALMLLLGLLAISIYFIVPGYHYYGSPQKIADNHSFILSEESPSHNITIYGPQIGISSLETNDTPVSIIIRHQDQVVFNATNIQEISDYDIEIPVPSSYGWQLEVVRQDADVSIDLTTHQWGIPVAYEMVPSYLTYLFAGIAIVFYSLYSMFKTYRVITSEDMKGAKFLAIIVLLLLGTLFCYPLADGIHAGDFTPRSTYVSNPDETYSFTLNGTHPISLLNLSLLYSGFPVYFNIHTMNSSDYPLKLAVITDLPYNITLEEESNDNDWWLSIPFNENSTSVVSFERIDTDLDIEFRLERRFLAILPRDDITIPAIFGVLGISAILVALFTAIRMDMAKTIT